MNPISYLPIIVASIVSFGISSLWYSPFLFGKEWLRALKTKEEDIENLRNEKVFRSYIVQLLFTIVSFAVLAFIVSFVDSRTGSDGAFLGLLFWIGYIVPNSVSGLLWKKEPFALLMIETVNTLLTLTIGGAIIGAWR